MSTKPRQAARFWRFLLLVPVLAMLAVPVFNRTAPTLWGFPFFYWYQMLWVILCAGAVGLVFVLEDSGRETEDDA